MKGIENISRSIVDEAKAKAEKILEEARQQAARIGEKAAQQTQMQEESLKKEAQTRAEELLRRSERTALLENKKGLLAARRQQIEKAYDLALRRLLSLEEGDYCALLVKLCQETGEKQGEILLNARDKARLGETLVEQINQKIGAAFTLGQEEKNIAGGFVLRQGPVEINCALETAVHLLEEETASQVAAILF